LVENKKIGIFGVRKSDKNIFRFFKKKSPEKNRTFFYRKNSDCKNNEEKRKKTVFEKGEK